LISNCQADFWDFVVTFELVYPKALEGRKICDSSVSRLPDFYFLTAQDARSFGNSSKDSILFSYGFQPRDEGLEGHECFLFFLNGLLSALLVSHGNPWNLGCSPSGDLLWGPSLPVRLLGAATRECRLGTKRCWIRRGRGALGSGCGPIRVGLG